MLAISTHGTSAFADAFGSLCARGQSDLSKAEPAVREILDEVQRGGDAAVLRYVEKFEKRTPRALLLSTRDFDGAAALERLPRDARDALRHAAARVTRFHERERDAMFSGGGFRYDEDGVGLGLRVLPLARVGVYAPGGKARYPSSVLMSAIPARVAGVKEILLATPLAGDATDDGVLAAAHLSGVTGIVDAGGAQAIGALAYGTSSIPRVDKIVGPGNIYVACAKRLVYGAVAIDSIAGPSEILVIADASADPAHVAADLLSQAEHDEDAYPLLLCTSRDFAEAVAREVERQLADLPRASIARASIDGHGHAFVAPESKIAELADAIAPEHLSIQVATADAADALAANVRNAGAVFLGRLTPEATGDYVAGPSHVLPTGGAVRFGSPLGVHDFVARTSLIRYSADALRRDETAICALARLEGLEAHARAVTIRTREAALPAPSRAGPDGGRRGS
ncbi:MAG: histidinol dehydrogenase [Labilithrix sp.]|nr:histidinol dehydrogenase [Labilithrix sp.]